MVLDELERLRTNVTNDRGQLPMGPEVISRAGQVANAESGLKRHQYVAIPTIASSSIKNKANWDGGTLRITRTLRLAFEAAIEAPGWPGSEGKPAKSKIERGRTKIVFVFSRAKSCKILRDSCHTVTAEWAAAEELERK